METIVCIILLILVIGFLNQLTVLIAFFDKRNFARVYISKYDDLKKNNEITDIKSDPLYRYLMENIDRMSDCVNNLSIIRKSEPASVDIAEIPENYSILMETITKFGTSELSYNEIYALDNTFLRYNGSLNSEKVSIIWKLVNPIALLMIGIKTILSFPVLSLFQADLISKEKKKSMLASKTLKVISILLSVFLITELTVRLIDSDFSLIKYLHDLIESFIQ